MKIETNTALEEVCYGDVDAGECLEWEGTVWLATSDDNQDDGLFLMVRLSDGETQALRHDEMVRPVKAKVVVE